MIDDQALITRRGRWAALILLSLAGMLNAQQRSAAEIETGAQLYRSSCTLCHGENGNQVPGVDFRSGQFRRAASDDDLVRIIGEGIPNTAMPPSSMPEASRRAIVAYLHSMHGSTSAAPSADVAAGKAIFEGKGNCTSCHRVFGEGSRTGPDLSEIGTRGKAADLMQSLVDPDAVISPANRYVRAVTKDGTVVTGRRLNENLYTVQLIDEHENLRSLTKADLREYSVLKNSPMPSYKDKLTSAELSNVVAYLLSLKGLPAQ
jgi:putative heme-binding domain-containing protein